MGTAVFYVDDHPDTRKENIKRRSYSSTYPEYKVDNLKITRVKMFDVGASADETNFRTNLLFEAYPHAWREKIVETYRGECLKNKDDHNIVFRSPFDVSKLREILAEDVVQYHIDPDAFHPSHLLRYFGKSPKAKHCNTVFGRHGMENPPSHFEFSELLDTKFLGVFEWYIKRLEGEEAYELLGNLKVKAMPDAKYVLLPRYISNHIPHKGKLGKSKILALDIMDGDGELITTRRKGPPFGPVELEGKPFDINELLKEGKVFFASETHADALLFFDSKPSD